MMKALLLIVVLTGACATTRAKVVGTLSLGSIAAGGVSVAYGNDVAGGFFILAGIFAETMSLYLGSPDEPLLRAWSGSGGAASGSYKQVQVVNGKADCSAAFEAQGQAVIRDPDGYYRTCDIMLGHCEAPGTWYAGEAVILDADGYFKTCEVINGRCAAPGSWYEGSAIIWCAK